MLSPTDRDADITNSYRSNGEVPYKLVDFGRHADITNSCRSNSEVPYKLVGFGRSGCRKPTESPLRRFNHHHRPRTELECMR